jgi:DNA-nicking Smr family endonuclease
MEVGDIDLATFMQRKAHQIDDKFIKYHWQEMLKCVQVIHEKSWFFGQN